MFQILCAARRVHVLQDWVDQYWDCPLVDRQPKRQECLQNTDCASNDVYYSLVFIATPPD